MTHSHEEDAPDAVHDAVAFLEEDILKIKTLGVDVRLLEDKLRSIKDKIKAKDLKGAERELKEALTIVDITYTEFYDSEALTSLMARLKYTLSHEEYHKLQTLLDDVKTTETWKNIRHQFMEILEKNNLIAFELMGKKYDTLKALSTRTLRLAERGLEIKPIMNLINTTSLVMHTDMEMGLRLVNNLLNPVITEYERYIKTNEIMKATDPILNNIAFPLKTETTHDKGLYILMKVLEASVDFDTVEHEKILKNLQEIAEESAQLEIEAHHAIIHQRIDHVDKYIRKIDELGVKINMKKVNDLKTKIENLMNVGESYKALKASETLHEHISKIVLKHYRKAIDHILIEANNVRAKCIEDRIDTSKIDDKIKEMVGIVGEYDKKWIKADEIIVLYDDLKSRKEEIIRLSNDLYRQEISRIKNIHCEEFSKQFDSLMIVYEILQDVSHEPSVDIEVLKNLYDSQNNVLKDIDSQPNIRDLYHKIKDGHEALAKEISKLTDEMYRDLIKNLENIRDNLPEKTISRIDENLITTLFENPFEIGIERYKDSYERFRKELLDNAGNDLREYVENVYNGVIARVQQWQSRMFYLERILCLCQYSDVPENKEHEISIKLESHLKPLEIWNLDVVGVVNNLKKTKTGINDFDVQKARLWEYLEQLNDLKLKENKWENALKKGIRKYVLGAMKDVVKELKSEIKVIKEKIDIDKEVISELKKGIEYFKNKEIDKGYEVILAVANVLSKKYCSIKLNEWKNRLIRAYNDAKGIETTVLDLYEGIISKMKICIENNNAISVFHENYWNDYCNRVQDAMFRAEEIKNGVCTDFEQMANEVEALIKNENDLLPVINKYWDIMQVAKNVEKTLSEAIANTIKLIIDSETTFFSNLRAEYKIKSWNEDYINSILKAIDEMQRTFGIRQMKVLEEKLSEYMVMRDKAVVELNKKSFETEAKKVMSIIDNIKKIIEFEKELKRSESEEILSEWEALLKDASKGIEQIKNMEEKGNYRQCALDLKDLLKGINDDLKEMVTGILNVNREHLMTLTKDLDSKIKRKYTDKYKKLEPNMGDLIQSYAIIKEAIKEVDQIFSKKYHDLVLDVKERLRAYKKDGMDVEPYLKEGAKIDKNIFSKDKKMGYEALKVLAEKIEKDYKTFRKDRMRRYIENAVGMADALSKIDNKVLKYLNKLKDMLNALDKMDIESIEKEFKEINNKLKKIRNKVLIERAKEIRKGIEEDMELLMEDERLKPKVDEIRKYLKNNFEVSIKENKGDLAYLYICKARNNVTRTKNEFYKNKCIDIANEVGRKVKDATEMFEVNVDAEMHELSQILKGIETISGIEAFKKIDDIKLRIEKKLETAIKDVMKRYISELETMIGKMASVGMEVNEVKTQIREIANKYELNTVKKLSELRNTLSEEYLKWLIDGIKNARSNIIEYLGSFERILEVRITPLPMKDILNSIKKAIVKVPEDIRADMKLEDLEDIYTKSKTLNHMVVAIDKFIGKRIEAIKGSEKKKTMILKSEGNIDSIKDCEDNINRVWSKILDMLEKFQGLEFDKHMKTLGLGFKTLFKEVEITLEETYKKAIDKARTEAVEVITRFKKEGIKIKRAEQIVKEADTWTKKKDYPLALYYYKKAKSTAEKERYDYLRTDALKKVQIYHEFIKRFEEFDLDIDRTPLDDIYELATMYINRGEFDKIDDKFIDNLRAKGEELYKEGINKKALSLMIELQGIVDDLKARDIPATETEKILKEVEAHYRDDNYIDCIQMAKNGIKSAEKAIKKWEIERAKKKYTELKEILSMLKDQGLEVDIYITTVEDLKGFIDKGEIENFNTRYSELYDEINAQKNAFIDEVRTYLINVEKYINAVKDLGINIRGPMNLLRHAKSEFEDGEYASAKRYAKKAKDYADELKLRYAPDKEIEVLNPEAEIEKSRCVEAIKTAWNIISKAKDSGIDIGDSERILDEARAALKSKKYKVGKEKAYEALKLMKEILEKSRSKKD